MDSQKKYGSTDVYECIKSFKKESVVGSQSYNSRTKPLTLFERRKAMQAQGGKNVKL